MLNSNSALDPQSPESRLAHVTCAEMPDDAIDHGPDGDPYHDAAAYRDEGDEPHHGWPGDGSGEDDLADLMAVGDEGCCDGPDDFCDDADPADDGGDTYGDDAPFDEFNSGE
jgi:hypothetical protein